jgi:hypothetical protein
MRHPYTKTEKLHEQTQQARALVSAAIGTKSRAEVDKLEAEADKLYELASAERDRVAQQEWQRSETRAADYFARFTRLETLIRQLIKKER